MPGGMKTPCHNCQQDVDLLERVTCPECGTRVAQLTLMASTANDLAPGAHALLRLQVKSTAVAALGELAVEIDDTMSVFEPGAQLAASFGNLAAGGEKARKLRGKIKPAEHGIFDLEVRVRYRDRAGLQWVFRGDWEVPCSQSVSMPVYVDNRHWSQNASNADEGEAVLHQTIEMGDEPSGEIPLRTVTGWDPIDLVLEEIHETGAHRERPKADPPPAPPEPEPASQGISEPMDCEVCGYFNPAGSRKCGGCRQPLPIGDLAGFSLVGVGAKTGTVKAFERVGAMLRGFGNQLKAPTDQLPGREEARLHRVLSRLAAELEDREFRLLTWAIASRLQGLKSPGRDVIRRAVRSVVRDVSAPRPHNCPGQPVFVRAEFEPNVRQNLALLTLTVERRPGTSISSAEVEILANPAIERVIKVVPPADTRLSLVEVVRDSLTFQVELHGSGTASLPVRIRLSCTEESADCHCACCYRTEFRWQLGVDDRNRTVINKLQVIEPDTSLVRVDFGGAPEERTTLDDDDDDDASRTLSRQARFDLPLSLDLQALEEQSDELYGASPAMVPWGGAGIRACHFLVRAGDRRRVLFVLLDDALTLGRSQNNHVVTRYGGLGDEKEWGFVCRRHAGLSWHGDNEGTVLTDGFDGSSTNPTRVRRGRRTFDLFLQSMPVVHGDRFHIPPKGGDVKHPYVLDLRAAHTWNPKKRQLRVLGQVLAPTSGMHRPLEHERPYLYCWLPSAGHEALVGFHPDLAAKLPGPGPDQVFRLLKDERGHLFVSPCSGISLTLTRGSLTRNLVSHAWYYLADEDELRCGDTTLTFNVHPHVGDDPPDLGGCYPGTRGPFDPPDDFRAMLLTLMVRNPA